MFSLVPVYIVKYSLFRSEIYFPLTSAWRMFFHMSQSGDGGSRKEEEEGGLVLLISKPTPPGSTRTFFFFLPAHVLLLARLAPRAAPSLAGPDKGQSLLTGLKA